VAWAQLRSDLLQPLSVHPSNHHDADCPGPVTTPKKRGTLPSVYLQAGVSFNGIRGYLLYTLFRYVVLSGCTISSAELKSSAFRVICVIRYAFDGTGIGASSADASGSASCCCRGISRVSVCLFGTFTGPQVSLSNSESSLFAGFDGIRIVRFIGVGTVGLPTSDSANCVICCWRFTSLFSSPLFPGGNPLAGPLQLRKKRKVRTKRSKRALAYPAPHEIPLAYRASNATAGCLAGVSLAGVPGRAAAAGGLLRVLIHRRAFSRRVMNHAEIAAGAAALPAEVSVLDDAALPHQAGLWRMHADADVVIAANGAGLANVHALRAGAALLEVVQYHHLSLHYAHAALALDVDYLGFISPTEKFEDVWVEPDRLLGKLCEYAAAKYGGTGGGGGGGRR
jgi:hypothetical protein